MRVLGGVEGAGDWFVGVRWQKYIFAGRDREKFLTLCRTIFGVFTKTARRTRYNEHIEELIRFYASVDLGALSHHRKLGCSGST